MAQSAFGDDAALARQIDQLRKDGVNFSADWREEAKGAFDLYAGHQWSDEDVAILKEELRPYITFNRIGPVLDAVAGMEVSNRHEVTYLPREEGDVQKNEVFSGAAQWVRDECEAEDEESDAFFDSLVCGMGWTETRLDLLDDPEGQVVIERIDPMQMYWDPGARKRNLSDARWIQRGKLMTRDEIEARWPDKADSVFAEMKPEDLSVTDDDFELKQAPHDASRAYLYRNDATQKYEITKAKIRVVEHQWWETESYYRVANVAQREIEDLTPSQFRRVKPIVDMFKWPFVKRSRKRYHRAFMAANVILERGDNPCPFAFTYQCITGKRDRNKNWWFGVVRAMRDPQMWANKFVSEILHIVNSNSKGGVMYETGAFEDAREAEKNWANPRGFVRTSEGAISGGKIQEKTAAKYPAGLDRLLEFTVSSLPMVTGMNMELLGLANRMQPGVLEEQRKRAGLTILATTFDSLRRYRKTQGRVLLFFIQTYISDGRLIRVMGDEGMRYVPLTKEDRVEKYDVIVDESPSSPNQRERTWAVLQAIIPVALQSGIPIPPAILDYMPLPDSLVQKWKQALQQQQQQSPQQQAMFEAQLRKLVAEAMAKEGQAAKAQAEAGTIPGRAEAETDKLMAEATEAQAGTLQRFGNVVDLAIGGQP